MQPLTIAKSTIIPFSLPLIQPFSFGGNTITERTGFYLEATTADGLTAKGEASPLPGISKELPKKAQHDLEEFLPFLSQWQVPTDREELIAQVKKHKQLAACCPSARFCIESLLFSLAAQAKHKDLGAFLGAFLDDVPSAALLQGTHQQVIAQAREMKEQGKTIFKLKVGDRNIPLDVKKVQDLRAVIGKDALIRLDANRVWSYNEAVLFVQFAGRGQIEFIEEPVSDLKQLDEFYQASHLPIALDETLSSDPGFATHEGVKVYVLKPMVLGGVVAALDWIDKGRRQGRRTIISSAFESPVGLSVLKALACLTEEPSGLGTEAWFKK